jgi:predicted pyridoxine 5'-phosphate oxidase superfamily flavin-nucleotide-binding protein
MGAVAMGMYHEGNRALQDEFDSRALADRLVERLWRDKFKDEDKAFIEAASFFLVASADREGRPDCSFKGGAPGFVKVVAPDLLVYPDYDGNGMFKTLGNIRVNPYVGLLFIHMDEKPSRLRVNGRASIAAADPSSTDFPGAQLLVEVRPEHIFPNCPRYIPNLKTGEASKYLPCPGLPAAEPAWKSSDAFKDVVPPRRA